MVPIHLPDHNEAEISVIDLLSDSGANSDTEENSAHKQEDHCLGKVDTETPHHSPKIPGRSFPNGFSPRQKDVDFSPYYNSIKQTFCSKDMVNITGDPNLMFLNRRCSSPFNWDCSPSFLDDSIDDLEESETLFKNCADQRNFPFEDYFHNIDIWKQDFNNDCWNLQKKRFSTKRTEDFDIRGFG
ncbi:hypothetical protein OROHE_024696 [Orobanche hederae]